MRRRMLASLGGAKKPWVNPYITDGLIAMWDGEWNAGGGVHDANATVWKDLIGDNDMTLTAEGSFTDNSFASLGGAKRTAVMSYDAVNILSIECVVKWNTAGAGRGAISFNSLGVTTPSNGGRYVTRRGNGTVNFCGNGSYMSASALGVAAAYCGIFSSTTSDTVEGYRNGVLQTLSKGGGYGFGANLACVSPFAGYPMDGEIYVARLYSRALTAEEVSANYAVDKERFGLP